MSFWVILIIIIIAGIAGGYINYLLPSNSNADGQKIRNSIICIVLGVGASLLVPLFLELAQSKLMDNIRYSWVLQGNECKADTLKVNVAVTIPGLNVADSSKPKPSASSTQQGTVSQQQKECPPLKNYLLFFGYCLVAAAAGLRFINGLLDAVLKDKQIADQQKKIAKTKEELEREKQEKEEAEKKRNIAEKQKMKLAAQDKTEAENEEEEALRNMAGLRIALLHDKTGVEKGMAIGPVTNADDRQKGRFGGTNERNGRLLTATVEDKPRGRFYRFTLTVTSKDPVGHPLTGEIYFFLHDSFTPSIVKAEVNEGKAEYSYGAWGAFTAGAVVDGGETLLELDLAEDKNFPREFRER